MALVEVPPNPKESPVKAVWYMRKKKNRNNARRFARLAMCLSACFTCKCCK